MLLPWLANGRLEASERLRIEQHVCACAACSRELEQQRRIRATLTEPERIVYAPGPSFRKLLERIDGAAAAPHPQPAPAAAVRSQHWRAAWRPPGLAWAASFVLAVAIATLGTELYRWSLPRYATHTDASAVVPQVVHVAFAPTLGAVDLVQLLRAAGGRVVAGPDATGVYGVAPLARDRLQPDDSRPPGAAARVLAARLRADPRVRWVEPQPGP
jgi:anti-sigma factor RsiW